MGASLAVPPAAAAAGRLTTSTVLKHIAGLLTLWFGSLSCPALASYHLELISVWLVALKSQTSSLGRMGCVAAAKSREQKSLGARARFLTPSYTRVESSTRARVRP